MPVAASITTNWGVKRKDHVLTLGRYGNAASPARGVARSPVHSTNMTNIVAEAAPRAACFPCHTDKQLGANTLLQEREGRWLALKSALYRFQYGTRLDFKNNRQSSFVALAAWFSFLVPPLLINEIRLYNNLNYFSFFTSLAISVHVG